MHLIPWLDGPMGLITRLDKQKGALEVLGKKHCWNLNILQRLDWLDPRIMCPHKF